MGIEFLTTDQKVVGSNPVARSVFGRRKPKGLRLFCAFLRAVRRQDGFGCRELAHEQTRSGLDG